ncbi:MAG: YHYH protein [Candidatus Sumerlaeaceae bacterium]|nr:YHYH protein [Candidatus Sumerlaeaceae bacterium]
MTPLILMVCHLCAADSQLTSWQVTSATQFARVREVVGGAEVTTWPAVGYTNNGGGQATPAYSDIQEVLYSTNYVYVYGNNLASHVMGPWYNNAGKTVLFGRWPSSLPNQFRFPRTPTAATTSTRTAVGGDMALLVNGVVCYNYGDAYSYKNSTSSEVSPGGDGIWNRLAYVAEVLTFDPANSHQPDSGQYHTHLNPIALRYQLGDNVAYNSGTDTYSETTASAHHSPIIGWAYDGYPIYGPWGYTIAMNSGSGVSRMRSGFVLRNGTNGTTNLNVTGRHSLPQWAADAQGRSTSLISSQYGPNTGGPGSQVLGRYAEDYDHLADLVSTQTYDLDRYNGRTCVTPEYPGGTYAYFVTVKADGTPAFPNMVGGQFYGVASGGRFQQTTETLSQQFTNIGLDFQDGSNAELNYTINPVKGPPDQALGRVAMVPNQTNGTIAYTSIALSLTGTHTGLSNIRLMRTDSASYANPTQFGQPISSDPGNSTISFADSYTTIGTFYLWLRGDVATTATGNLLARVTGVSQAGGNLTGFSSNEAMSNGPALFSSAYIWNVNGSGDYQIAGNWTPTRSSPSPGDELIIDGALTAGPVTLTNCNSEAITTLTVTNGVSASLYSSGAKQLTILGSATIGSGSALNLYNNVTLNLEIPTVTANGDLRFWSGSQCNTKLAMITGSGYFSAEAGSTLEIENSDGIVASGASGQIQTTTRSFSSQASYVYSGTTQATGSGLPTTVADLLAYSDILNLSNNLTVNGNLDVGCTLQTAAKTLTLNGTAVVEDVSALVVQSSGALYTSGTVITGNGEVHVMVGGTLETKNASGIASSGATGAVQTATRTFDSGSNYVFDSSSPQVSGNALPLSVGNLSCGDLTLSTDTNVNGALQVDLGRTLGSGAYTLGLNGTTQFVGNATLNIANGGRLNTNQVVVNGGTNSSLVVDAGATLETKNAAGLHFDQMQISNISLSSSAKYVYDGSSAQNTGFHLPATVDTLTISNPTTVTLSGATTATTQLVLNQGCLDTNGATIVVNTDGQNAVTRSNNAFIKGTLKRYFDRNLGDTFRIYPVGTSVYAGVDIYNSPASAQTGYVTVSTTDGDPPSAVAPSGVLDRYWTVTATGFNPAGLELQFHYLDSDVTGTLNENTMVLARYNAGAWEEITPDFRDTSSNIITEFSVPGFSVWTAANPGAAPVNLSRFHLD